MSEWQIQLPNTQEKQTVSAHTVEVQSSGALVFRNNGEDCPVKIFAANHWSSVDRITDNHRGYSRS